MSVKREGERERYRYESNQGSKREIERGSAMTRHDLRNNRRCRSTRFHRHRRELTRWCDSKVPAAVAGCGESPLGGVANAEWSGVMRTVLVSCCDFLGAQKIRDQFLIRPIVSL